MFHVWAHWGIKPMVGLQRRGNNLVRVGTHLRGARVTACPDNLKHTCRSSTGERPSNAMTHLDEFADSWWGNLVDRLL